jgi:hypothetical protein
MPRQLHLAALLAGLPGYGTHETGDTDGYAEHDALNRAAKALPGFLEALRDESVLVPIVTVGSSAW